MSSVAARLMLPATVSIVGIVLTQLWYNNASKVTKEKRVGSPIAHLQQRTDHIERRSTTRLIWQDAEQGDPLFAGEAVRTSSKASGRIHFIQSGVTVGLEPDSVVVIEETKGNVTLNLVNGGIFVKNDDASPPQSGGSQPLLRAGNKTISMTDKKSELSLSLSDSGQANVSVNKGKVAIQGAVGSQITDVTAGQSAAVTTTQDAPRVIELVSPRANAILPLSTASATVPIQWKPLAISESLSLEIGAERNRLIPVVTGLAASSGTAKLPLRPGGFFWRLSAKNSANKLVAQSSTLYNEGIALEAPRLLTFAGGEHVYSEGPDTPMIARLSWSRPSGAKDVSISVSTDRDFNQIIASQKFADTNDWNFSTTSTGVFYWRATAAWVGIEPKLTSVTGSFQFERQKDLPTPTIISPKDGESFMMTDIATSGLVLAWNKLEGIPQYSVEIARQKPDGSWPAGTILHADLPQYRFKELRAGNWRWSVASLRGVTASKPSPPQIFKVLDVISLDTGSITGSPHVLEVGDIVNLYLRGIPSSASRVRFKVGAKTTPIESLSWIQGSKDGKFSVKLKGPGTYQFKCEVLDQAEHVFAASDAVLFEVRMPDLLEPPILSGETKEIRAAGNGTAFIQWTGVKGATGYLVSIAGSRSQKIKVAGATSAKIPGLLPGTYKFVLISIDRRGRLGSPGTEYSLTVPNTSDLVGPKARSVKVRD